MFSLVMKLAMAQLSFKNATFHVAITSTPMAGDFKVHDMHILNGEVSATGGLVSASCLNGTVKPYTIIFGPTKLPITINATLETADGTKLAVSGMANCFVPAPPGWPQCPQLHWNTPASATLSGDMPPPPPACTGAYTQTACDAVDGSCEWCTSSDKLHALCFDKTDLPSAGSNQISYFSHNIN